MTLLARQLERDGYDVEVISEVPHYRAGQHDLFICSRPGPGMCEFLLHCLKAGKQVIVDMDDDFNSIPKSNPAYPWIGPGAGDGLYLKKLAEVLGSVQCITYASKELANRYKLPGVYIPNYWDEENELWYGEPLPLGRTKTTIGWSGTNTHHEDFALCEQSIHDVLKSHSDVNLMISNDFDLYGRFSDVAEGQKVFIPGLSYDEYPTIYRYIDIMVAPLKDDFFNRAKSDVKLMECGARGIPWVASALPVFEEWGAGGIIAGRPGSDVGWAEALNSLVENSELRTQLGQEGCRAAKERMSNVMYIRNWRPLIDGMLRNSPIQAEGGIDED
jgi:glycosyltransferase involved in cell wall biosynthesis